MNYLDEVDPESARVARERYGCLTPWQRDPATYGHAALTGSYPTCKSHVVRALTDLLAKRRTYAEHDGERFLDAEQNARLVANAERYYRIMYYGSRASWNLRDSHMFETLKNCLPITVQTARRSSGRTIPMWATPERPRWPREANTISVSSAARSSERGPIWSGLVRTAGRLRRHPNGMVRWKSRSYGRRFPDSYEQLCHATGLARFMLGLRGRDDLCKPAGLGKERLERAIGVIYRPETELASHYFRASLPHQFDEYIWFDDSRAVTPLETAEIKGLPDTYPFGV